MSVTMMTCVRWSYFRLNHTNFRANQYATFVDSETALSSGRTESRCVGQYRLSLLQNLYSPYTARTHRQRKVPALFLESVGGLDPPFTMAVTPSWMEILRSRIASNMAHILRRLDSHTHINSLTKS